MGSNQAAGVIMRKKRIAQKETLRSNEETTNYYSMYHDIQKRQEFGDPNIIMIFSPDTKILQVLANKLQSKILEIMQKEGFKNMFLPVKKISRKEFRKLYPKRKGRNHD